MYVKIIDRGECFSTTPEFIDGVYANRTEWEKHNFYPQNGMVGEVVKRTPSAYIVKIMDGIYVPMTRNGIEEIEYDEFIAGQECNVCCGMDARQKRINSQVDDFNSMTGYNWQHLPDMRQYFKTDIISNISKLTCDFKRNIYLPDLQESAIMYTLDMCIEYQKNQAEKFTLWRLRIFLIRCLTYIKSFLTTNFPMKADSSAYKRLNVIWIIQTLRTSFKTIIRT